MYTTSNVRKFLNASNTLILESNENVINKFTEMILLHLHISIMV